MRELKSIVVQPLHGCNQAENQFKTVDAHLIQNTTEDQ